MSEETVLSIASMALSGMTWNKSMANWAEKKGGSVTLKIKPPELMAPPTEMGTAA